MNTLPQSKTCINCFHYDECMSFGATQFSNKCLFPISKFHEHEIEEVFVEITGDLTTKKGLESFLKRKKHLEEYLETTGRLNYISPNGRVFGMMFSKAGATYLKNGLKNSKQFKKQTKILINYSK